ATIAARHSPLPLLSLSSLLLSVIVATRRYRYRCLTLLLSQSLLSTVAFTTLSKQLS
ncbi:hypothetical protein GW17_00060147, partial [Ensete ventricosum]